MGEYRADLKVQKVVVKFNESELEEFMKSDTVNDITEEVARDLKFQIRTLTDSDEWEIERHDRPSRLTWLVYTNDNDQKWLEVATGRISKWIRRNLIRGKVRRKI